MAFGQVLIMNSTIAENIGGSGTSAAAIFLHSGVLSLVNDTITNNTTPSLDPFSAGGILADPANNGRIELLNTILAENTRRGLASDCGGAPITSLGNNLFGSLAGCTVSLLSTDKSGDPDLGPLTNSGTPGNGHYPLLDTSVAINAGNNDVCLSNPLLSTDQIGNPRVGVCDIGSIEFQPLDIIPPVISGMPVGCTLSPPNHQLIQVAIVTASDAQSGIAPGSFNVTGSSNEPLDTGDILITPTASGAFVVQLRAVRLGNGNGRIYTLTATAADLAGNRATATSTCVVPHDRGR